MIVIEGGGMAEYVIALRGCRGATAFHVWLSPTEAALVRQLSLISRAESTTDCQPRLYIEKCDDTTTGIDKVVSIDEQNPAPSPFGNRARLRLAGGMAGGPPSRAGRFGGGGGVRVEPVGDAVSGVAGEDRPR